MKNTDYRDGLHLVVAGRIPQVLAGDGTERHEEAESPDSSTAVITENNDEVADGSGRREKVACGETGCGEKWVFDRSMVVMSIQHIWIWVFFFLINR